MKVIRTDVKGWQEEMGACMKNKEKFILITRDQELARSLQDGKITKSTLRLLLVGTAGAATSGAVVGLSGVAPTLLLPFGLLAVADPEPVSKTVLISVCAVIGLIVGASVIYGITVLVRHKYKFTSRVSHGNTIWEFVAEPA